MRTVGKFTIDGGKISGPKAYMESANYSETVRKIENGTHVLIGMFAPGTPVEQIIGVIVQTDFAAWVGQRELEMIGGGK